MRVAAVRRGVGLGEEDQGTRETTRESKGATERSKRHNVSCKEHKSDGRHEPDPMLDA
jgi:hypothetical protein